MGGTTATTVGLALVATVLHGTATPAGSATTTDVPAVTTTTDTQSETLRWQQLRDAERFRRNAEQRVALNSLSGEHQQIPAAIAACESGHRLPDGTAEPHTHDWAAQNSRSSASGAFQFIDGTWEWVWQEIIGEQVPAPHAGDADPADQLRAFWALWRDGQGSRHWDASKSCWRQMIGTPDL
jgi:hypothetical protein